MLSGDFNIDQTNEGYKLLNESGIMKDAYDMADYRYIEAGTYNAYNPNGSRMVNGEPQRIDHIFLTPEFSVKKYGVLTDTYRTMNEDSTYVARTPSDHFPVMIEVEMNKTAK